MATFTYPHLAPDNQPRTQISPTVCPSAISAYQPYFDDTLNSSHVPPTPGSASVASLPPSSPCSLSPFDNNSESDVGGDADYGPPSDDEEYHPTQIIPSKTSKKAKKVSQPKSSRRKGSSSSRRKRSSNTHASSSGSEASASSSRVTGRSRSSSRLNASRNFQRVDGSAHVDKGSIYYCPVVGCVYEQYNHRVPELKRHAETHDRWMDPEKWICRGVGMDVAHLYDVGIEEGMSEEECVQAGAYVYRGQLMIGGCMETFSRRDALKRHVDNPRIECIGDMYSY